MSLCRSHEGAAPASGRFSAAPTSDASLASVERRRVGVEGDGTLSNGLRAEVTAPRLTREDVIEHRLNAIEQSLAQIVDRLDTLVRRDGRQDIKCGGSAFASRSTEPAERMGAIFCSRDSAS